MLFDLYDSDHNSFIDEIELFNVLKLLVGADLKDDQLKEIVLKTMEERDLDGDKKLNFEEFCQVFYFSKNFLYFIIF